MRKLDTPVVLSRRRFAQNFVEFWNFTSTNWANIMRMELFQQIGLSEVLAINQMSNGGDTVFMLKYMAHCERIGIDSTTLYHYCIRPKQVSKHYNRCRFDSNLHYIRAIQVF